MILPKTKNRYRKRKLIIPTALLFLFGMGFVFSRIKNTDISFPKKMINPAVEFTPENNLKSLMSQYRLYPEAIDIQSEKVIATFSGNLTVQMATDRDLKYQVASLQLIVSRSKIEGRVPEEIDLRFDNPIVKYK